MLREDLSAYLVGVAVVLVPTAMCVPDDGRASIQGRMIDRVKGWTTRVESERACVPMSPSPALHARRTATAVKRAVKLGSLCACAVTGLSDTTSAAHAP